MFTRREMVDLIDDGARGIVVRNLVTGEYETHTAHAVAAGGYSNVFFLDERDGVQRDGRLALPHAANPCYEFTDCIPKPATTSRSSRYVGVPVMMGGVVQAQDDARSPNSIPDASATTTLSGST